MLLMFLKLLLGNLFSKTSHRLRSDFYIKSFIENALIEKCFYRLSQWIEWSVLKQSLLSSEYLFVRGCFFYRGFLFK